MDEKTVTSDTLTVKMLTREERLKAMQATLLAHRLEFGNRAVLPIDTVQRMLEWVENGTPSASQWRAPVPAGLNVQTFRFGDDRPER